MWKSRWPSLAPHPNEPYQVSVDVKQQWTMHRYWSQFVPNITSTRHPRTLSSTSSSSLNLSVVVVDLTGMSFTPINCCGWISRHFCTPIICCGWISRHFCTPSYQLRCGRFDGYVLRHHQLLWLNKPEFFHTYRPLSLNRSAFFSYPSTVVVE